jgi:hypothetical protein
LPALDERFLRLLGATTTETRHLQQIPRVLLSADSRPGQGVEGEGLVADGSWSDEDEEPSTGDEE